MIGFTIIARQSDALALAADTEQSNPEVEKLKVTAKNVLRKLSTSPQYSTTTPRLTIEASTYSFHIAFEGGVMFMAETDTLSPGSVVFGYLEDIAKEFLNHYGTQIDGVKRPYVFIKFDHYLQKAKKTHLTRAAQQRPPPRTDVVKKTFRDVMGFGDAGPSSASTVAAGGKPAGGKSWISTNDNVVIIAVVAISFILIIVVLLVVIALTES